MSVKYAKMKSGYLTLKQTQLGLVNVERLNITKE